MKLLLCHFMKVLGCTHTAYLDWSWWNSCGCWRLGWLDVSFLGHITACMWCTIFDGRVRVDLQFRPRDDLHWSHWIHVSEGADFTRYRLQAVWRSLLSLGLYQVLLRLWYQEPFEFLIYVAMMFLALSTLRQ
eukprot:TRINITY_DN16782_c0_g2_i1.p1 TRINITY_DN16782_c0_g2~~TRINITY_DN16782_c0_g2_i1.p1  ORF type:complete len:132 (+),score=5.36 TRINITY_DN16782_c0_g2_i1:547-942(+)